MSKITLWHHNQGKTITRFLNSGLQEFKIICATQITKQRKWILFTYQIKCSNSAVNCFTKTLQICNDDETSRSTSFSDAPNRHKKQNNFNSPVAQNSSAKKKRNKRTCYYIFFATYYFFSESLRFLSRNLSQVKLFSLVRRACGLLT